jgi:hypothetical protein
MVRALLANHAQDSLLASAIGNNFKERLSLYIYTAAVLLAFISPWIAMALYVTVAIMWLIPDRRIENRLTK